MSLTRSLICGLACAASSLSSSSFAASIGLTDIRTFTVPFGGWLEGAADYGAIGFNDNGDIAGTFTSPTAGTAGFVIPADGSAPVQIDRSGAQFTIVYGINNQGTLVGRWEQDSVQHGFSYSNGVFTSVDLDNNTYPLAINNHGDIVGYSNSFDGPSTGFLIENGTVATLGPRYTPKGINDLDQVVGFDSDDPRGGFLRQSNGSFETLDFNPYAMNNAGIIVGYQYGGPVTVMIGSAEYTVEFPWDSYAYTYIGGINNLDQVMGAYQDPNFTWHIFEGRLALVPEPATGALCGLLAIVGIAVAIRRRCPNHDSAKQQLDVETVIE